MARFISSLFDTILFDNTPKVMGIRESLFGGEEAYWEIYTSWCKRKMELVHEEMLSKVRSNVVHRRIVPRRGYCHMYERPIHSYVIGRVKESVGVHVKECYLWDEFGRSDPLVGNADLGYISSDDEAWLELEPWEEE